jgi:RNA polymerase sigma factor (sigma-70 family)
VLVDASAATPPAIRPASRQRLSAAALADLCERAGRGDERAWRALVNEFSGVVWAIARAHGLGAADAADVMQETFLRFVENLQRLRDPQRAGAWLATTARRQCLAVLRHRARVLPGDVPDAVPDDTPGVEIDLITAERDEALWRAFERLSQRDRALLRLLIVEPAPPYEEVGAALGMPIGSIGPTRARALERLRRHARQLGVLDQLSLGVA